MLQKFIVAQESVLEQVEKELVEGKKMSHWMWFIFPQLQGLGQSETSHYYGLVDLEEAKNYINHPLLGPRLIKCVNIMLKHKTGKPAEILGEVDALKFKSCLTLFCLASIGTGCHAVFDLALNKYFNGKKDIETVNLLKLGKNRLSSNQSIQKSQ